MINSLVLPIPEFKCIVKIINGKEYCINRHTCPGVSTELCQKYRRGWKP